MPEIQGIDPNDFETFDWKGQTRYKCNLFWESGTKCEYDTYDLTMLKEHLKQPHVRAVMRERPQQPRPIPVYVTPLPDEIGATGSFKGE